jgi:lipoprotein-releasing system permease protein
VVTLGVGGVLSLFVQYGLVVGLIGATLGMVAGVTTLTWLDPIEAFVLKWTGYTPWPRGVFYFRSIPREMNWGMFWTFWAGGIAVSFLASLVPAARAARTDPVATLRYQ